MLCRRRSHLSQKSAHRNKEKSPRSNEDPVQPNINKEFFKKPRWDKYKTTNKMVDLNPTISRTTGLEYCYWKCGPWNHGPQSVHSPQDKHKQALRNFCGNPFRIIRYLLIHIFCWSYFLYLNFSDSFLMHFTKHKQPYGNLRSTDFKEKGLFLPNWIKKELYLGKRGRKKRWSWRWNEDCVRSFIYKLAISREVVLRENDYQ